jgi:hypothetical protein
MSDSFAVVPGPVTETKFTVKLTATLTATAALFIALTSFAVENTNDYSLFYKNDSIDQWSYFQAKSVREKIYELESNRLTLTLPTDPLFSEKAKLAQTYRDKAEEYRQEKQTIKSKAEEFTSNSEYYGKKGDVFELARIFFELAIVLSAIFLLNEKKFFFLSSLSSGFLGLVFILWGILY